MILKKLKKRKDMEQPILLLQKKKFTELFTDAVTLIQTNFTKINMRMKS